jgi:hypothetical protein
MYISKFYNIILIILYNVTVIRHFMTAVTTFGAKMPKNLWI